MSAFSLFSAPEPVFKAANAALSNQAASFFLPEIGSFSPAGNWGTGSPAVQIQQYQGWVRTAVATKARLVCSVPQVVRVTHESERMKYRKALARHERGVRIIEKSMSMGLPFHGPIFPEPARRDYVPRIDRQSGRVVTKDWKPQEELEYLPPTDRVSKLFSDPNGPLTGETFWRLFGTYYYLCGDVYLLVLRDKADKLPAEMWVVPTHWVQTSFTFDGRPQYAIKPPGSRAKGMTDLTDEQLLRFHSPHPYHPGLADSPIDAMAKAIDIYNAVEEAQFNELRNRPFTSGMFKLDPNVVKGGLESIKPALEAIQSAYFGYRSAGRTPPLPPGVEWSQLNTTHEIGFQNSRDAGRAAILAHAGLDEAALGYSNESTYAGASVTDRRIQKQMVQPDQRLIASWLTEAVLRPFSDSAGEEYRAAFVNQDAMEDPAEKRANIVAIADDLSQNERRQAMGFEPYEHELADIPTRLIPFVADEEEYPQLVSGGMDGGNAPDKTDQPATEDEQAEDDPPEPTDDAEKSLQPRFSLNGHAGHD